jgi:hypothetical protein
VGKAFGDDLAAYDSDVGCINRYRSLMRKKAALIVVDDVCRSADVEPFRAQSLRSPLLFTTRDASGIPVLINTNMRYVRPITV